MNDDASNDFEFYTNLFLSYYSDVEKMAYDKKRYMLSQLFRNMCVFDTEKQENPAIKTDAADFAELE